MLPLEWRNVDFKAGEIRQNSGTTKNRDGRVFKMTTELRTLLETQFDGDLSDAVAKLDGFPGTRKQSANG